MLTGKTHAGSNRFPFPGVIDPPTPFHQETLCRGSSNGTCWVFDCIDDGELSQIIDISLWVWGPKGETPALAWPTNALPLSPRPGMGFFIGFGLGLGDLGMIL